MTKKSKITGGVSALRSGFIGTSSVEFLRVKCPAACLFCGSGARCDKEIVDTHAKHVRPAA